jgi:nitroreductase
MDIYQAISSRRTVRDFEDRPIDEAVLRRIIEAGLMAPTNNHMREWEFIVFPQKQERYKAIQMVRDRERNEAVDIVDKWGLVEDSQRNMYIDAIPKQHRMLMEAGCLIIPLFRQYEPLLTPGSLSSLNGFASIWCCIENMLLAAASEGIMGVTRIPFDEEVGCLKTMLNVPQGYEIPCYLALGYPVTKQPEIRQHPVDADKKIHLNKW